MSTILIATLIVLILVAMMVAVILVLVLSDRKQKIIDSDIKMENWKMELWNFTGSFSISVPFQESIVLGRKNIYQYVINLRNPPVDASISREHFVVYEQQGVLWIQNMSSVNPLYVNGVQISTVSQLHVGDQLSVGKSLFMVTRLDKEIAA